MSKKNPTPYEKTHKKLCKCCKPNMGHVFQGENLLSCRCGRTWIEHQDQPTTCIVRFPLGEGTDAWNVRFKNKPHDPLP